MKRITFLKHFSRGFFLLACIIVIIDGSVVCAGTYFVAITGNDSGNGSEISPFRTIKKGVTVLGAGDTLYVKAGTYAESILSWKTPVPNGKGWDKPITVAAYPGHAVTITPPKGLAFFWINDGQPKYLIIDGFIVDGVDQALHGFKFYENTRYVRIQNTEVKNSTMSGILVTPGSDLSSNDTFHEFIKMKVHHNGHSRLDHGFYVTTSSNLFENNEVFLNRGYGIHIYQGKINTANHNLVRYNLVHNNSLDGWSCGILLSSGEGNIAYSNIAYENHIGLCSQYRSTNAKLYNNIAYQNNAYGIYVGDPTNLQTGIYNNTVYKNGIHGVFIGEGAQKASVKNNIVYLNGSQNIFEQEQGKSEAVFLNNVTADPLFMNVGGNDFHLKHGSPAIDAGITIDGIALDYERNPRIIGKASDVGAFEMPEDSNPPAIPTDFRVVTEK